MVKHPEKFAPKGTNFLENSNFALVGNLFGERGGFPATMVQFFYH